MASTHTLGKLQLDIMRILWKQGEASVADVHEELNEERALAPTTVATMLVKMEKKGVVSHRTHGRKYLYSPTVTETEVRRTMVADLTDHLFQGDVTELVGHLLSEHDATDEENEEIQRLLEEHGERKSR